MFTTNETILQSVQCRTTLNLISFDKCNQQNSIEIGEMVLFYSCELVLGEVNIGAREWFYIIKN